MPELQDAIVHIGVPGLNGGGVSTGTLATEIATRAPDTAAYILKTANAELGSAQALSSLSTGLLKVTTGTGVLSTATAGDLPIHTTTGVVIDKQMIIDGGGSTITTGIKGDFRITVPCTITEWNLFADQTGSIQIDLWRQVYTSYPPVDANSITGSAPIAMTTVNKWAVGSGGLTGWDTTLDAGDIIRVNVDSVASIQRVTLVLWMTRSV